MFVIQVSTSHYDSTVLRQITCDTQKLYGHKSTMHPKKTCYTWKQRGIPFQLTHVWDRIFNFLLVVLCLLASISDLFICLHYQGIDILVTLCAIPSAMSWWWSKQPEDWIHPKSIVFLMAAVIFSLNWMCVSNFCLHGVGLRPLACWDCGFESHPGHGCLSVVSVVCCQVAVSATDWSFVQRSPTDCGASLYVIKKPRKRGGWSPLEGCKIQPPMGVVAPGKKKLFPSYHPTQLQKHLQSLPVFQKSVCLYGSSVRGTWREGSLAGDPEG